MKRRTPFLSDRVLKKRLKASWHPPAKEDPRRGNLLVCNIAGTLEFTTFDAIKQRPEFDTRLLNQITPCNVDESAQFSRLMARIFIGDIRATISTFDEGPTVVTGPVDLTKLHVVALFYSQMISSIRGPGNAPRYRVSDIQVSIRNIVLSGKLPYSVDCIKIHRHLASSRYHPQTFPGVIVPRDATFPSYIVFDTGAIIISGVTPSINIHEMWASIKATLEPFADDSVSTTPAERSRDRRVAYENYLTDIETNALDDLVPA